AVVAVDHDDSRCGGSASLQRAPPRRCPGSLRETDSAIRSESARSRRGVADGKCLAGRQAGALATTKPPVFRSVHVQLCLTTETTGSRRRPSKRCRTSAASSAEEPAASFRQSTLFQRDPRQSAAAPRNAWPVCAHRDLSLFSARCSFAPSATQGALARGRHAGGDYQQYKRRDQTYGYRPDRSTCFCMGNMPLDFESYLIFVSLSRFRNSLNHGVMLQNRESSLDRVADIG
ncbi:hypothetical protein L917_21097, partial [Phytophthora nicotianae]